jgi:charged multivesicular body protein 6
MKNQRDKLRQYQKRITVITDREKAVARECLARGDKDKALLALRRKKYQESLLAKTDSQLEQLEKLTSNVEFALVQKDVLYGLKQGTQVLQQIHKEMGGLEAVEKLMGESEEARAYQQVRFISEAILTAVYPSAGWPFTRHCQGDY